jgi:hypothetical protein
MANFAQSTGGLFLHDNNDLDASLRSLVPETTYRLGFTPANMTENGKYHSLKIRLVSAGSNHVLARRGYFMPAPAKAAEASRSLDQEAAGTDTPSDLPVRFVAEPAPNAVRVTLIVDVRQLKFTEHDARRMQKLSFVAALFHENGDFVTGRAGELNFAFKDATYAHFAETGMSTRVSIQAPPGMYRLRGVVEDSAGKTTASMQVVEIR